MAGLNVVEIFAQVKLDIYLNHKCIEYLLFLKYIFMIYEIITGGAIATAASHG